MMLLKTLIKTITLTLLIHMLVLAYTLILEEVAFSFGVLFVFYRMTRVMILFIVLIKYPCDAETVNKKHISKNNRATSAE